MTKKEQIEQGKIDGQKAFHNVHPDQLHDLLNLDRQAALAFADRQLHQFTSRGSANYQGAFINGFMSAWTAAHNAQPEVARRGADLAGACEGEHIAALIDLALTIRDETEPAGITPAERLADALGQLEILRSKARQVLAEIERRA